MLELALTAIPGTVGIGELWLVLRSLASGEDIGSLWCQCGQQASKCPLWAEVAKLVSRDAPCGDSAIYAHVLDVVAELYGQDVVIIDSSKRMEALDALIATPNIEDIRVIHLVRDVRGWATSILKRGNLPTGRIPVPRVIIRTFPYLMLIWYSRVQKINRYLIDTGLPIFNVGYEQYATDPNRHISRIAKFADLVKPSDDAPSDDASGTPISHMLAGNPMRTDPDRRSTIVYDTRWMAQTTWLWAAAILRPVMRYNAEVVYNASGATNQV